MSIPLFFPPVSYLKKIPLAPSLALRTTLRELCQHAGIQCKASGGWTDRAVEIVCADEIRIFAEPGDWGKVRIELPDSDIQQQARLALATLAYGMHDLVAKQSLQGAKWRKLGPPRGRPRSSRALSVKERQRKFRMRKSGVLPKRIS